MGYANGNKARQGAGMMGGKRHRGIKTRRKQEGVRKGEKGGMVRGGGNKNEESLQTARSSH